LQPCQGALLTPRVPFQSIIQHFFYPRKNKNPYTKKYKLFLPLPYLPKAIREFTIVNFEMG
jgi:hypothetical protein